MPKKHFTFYKPVFGGEFAKVIRFKELASPEFAVAEKEENKIMHITLPIGKSSMLIANDVREILGKANENENIQAQHDENATVHSMYFNSNSLTDSQYFTKLDFIADLLCLPFQI